MGEERGRKTTKGGNGTNKRKAFARRLTIIEKLMNTSLYCTLYRENSFSPLRFSRARSVYFCLQLPSTPATA